MLDFLVSLYLGFDNYREFSSDPELAGGVYLIAWWMLLDVFYLVCAGKILAKAGRSPWKVLVPVVAELELARIAELPALWVVALLGLPLLQLYQHVAPLTLGFDLSLWLSLSLGVMSLIWVIRIAHRFGQETGFVIGLILLAPIFFGILAFGAAEYRPTYRRGRA